MVCTQVNAQKATITEEQRSLKTYPFSDPDPVPILTDNPKIYPYFKYEGYSHEASRKDWKVIQLSNDYVDVFILPEVGGKVWGAIEKSTGHEFIYRNEVMKFRNISMRGPWTSGGIEFNFGIIGHHPSTATPVDYVIQEHPDGSVSCTVGNIDLPSRTQWRVTIHLPKDKAAFETEALWYNPTPLNQAYYNWMTGAAPARNDFEFFTPGDELLKHSGEALPWPIDEQGRNLALYDQNRFGGSKSYHIVGEYNDFFGGYYHDANYGFGHWGAYDDIPGQKLWLWALSRSGGIWEDLLTDTDGQYIEFQAGRQFLQFAPDSHINPQTQANFEPHSADQWKEVWFPVKETGGLTDASEDAVMHVERKGNQLTLTIHTFVKCEAVLEINSKAKTIHQEPLSLDPMQVYKKELTLADEESFEIRVDEMGLHFTSDPDDLLIKRPFHSETPSKENTTEKLYKSAREDMKFRLYSSAAEQFEKVLLEDPYHLDAMIALAELRYRQGLYEEGLKMSNSALQLDTYHPAANYFTGIIYRAMGDYLNAKEALGWAARSLQYRSNAYAQIGEILLAEQDFAKAEKYASKALLFNQLNINALQVKAIALRKLNQLSAAFNTIQEIEKIDPLNHFSKFEYHLISGKAEDLESFKQTHRSELAYQTYLELAIDYFNKGMREESIKVLDAAPQHPIVDLWWCYLQQDASVKYFSGIGELDPDFVFPFRRETLDALQWANEHSTHWKLKYYHALNLWGKGRKEEAASIMKALENTPDYAPFYVARASLLQSIEDADPLKDLQKAKELNPQDWRHWQSVIKYYLEKKQIQKALDIAKEAYQSFPENYAIGMDYAQALNENKQFENSINLLAQLKVLPFEGASAGRKLYEQAHYGRAVELIQAGKYDAAIELLHISKLWPETLGVGKPFDPDERVADYLLALAYEKTGDQKRAEQLRKYIVEHTEKQLTQSNYNTIFGLLAFRQMGQSDKAEQMLQKITKSSIQDHPSTQWITAYYSKDLQKQKEIIQKNKLDENEQLTFIRQILNL